MYEEYGLFINGEWTAGSKELEVRLSAIEQKLGVSPAASREDTLTAFEAMEGALAPPREAGRFAGADLIRDNTEEAVQIILTETGKVLAKLQREWKMGHNQFRWHTEKARRIYARTVKSPLPGGKYKISGKPIDVVGTF